MKKKILDVCCGLKAMWFNKNHPLTIYQDIREEHKGFSDFRPTFHISPDIIGDFRSLIYPDNHFKLVVMDPPHIRSDKSNIRMTKFYGHLEGTWKDDIKRGFDECMRVLEPYGVLIFKWNETSIKKKELLEVLDPPENSLLFGHPVGSRVNTHWLCFMKMGDSK